MTDPQTKGRTAGPIARELAALAKERQGLLKPADVVEYARNPKTALHRSFEWDDTAAARAYRLWQARELIRCTVIHLAELHAPIRAYVSLTTDRSKDGGGYRHLVDVLARPAWRDQMLADALAELETFWEKGIPATECLNHAMAHLVKWSHGDRSEDHLAHVAANLFFIMHYEKELPEMLEGIRGVPVSTAKLRKAKPR